MEYINLYQQMTFVKDSSIPWNTNRESNGNFIIRTMTENRKRSREEDSCEFMPLSKRINNLHINNNLNNSNIIMSQISLESSQSSHVDSNCIPSPGSSIVSDRRPSYDPGPNSSQSNYYYENKLLFELHLERIQRTGQQFPF